MMENIAPKRVGKGEHAILKIASYFTWYGDNPTYLQHPKPFFQNKGDHFSAFPYHVEDSNSRRTGSKYPLLT